MLPLKVCTQCKDTKRLEDFHHDSDGSNGYRSRCKQCARQYQLDHAEEIRAYMQTYMQEYHKRDYVKAKTKKWRQDNAEKVAAKSRRYYARKKARVEEIQLPLDPPTCYTE